MKKLLLIGTAVLLMATSAHADCVPSADGKPITPEEYHRTVGPCACPSDLKSNGARCGNDSAFCRRGGWAPSCGAKK
jgi:hypothetical protein